MVEGAPAVRFPGGRRALGTLPLVESIWRRPRAVSAHVALALSEPGFAALTWWQVRRALTGNRLSWAYAFEWPIFGLYAVYLWWKIVHAEEPDTLPAEDAPPAKPAAAPAPRRQRRWGAAGSAERLAAEERQLAAYNRYLASLAEEDARRG